MNTQNLFNLNIQREFMKTLVYSLIALLGSAAMADFNLANSPKEIFCYADDSYTWELNAKRTTVKFSVEGENLGAQKITRIATDSSTFASYKTSEGTLFLSNHGDGYVFPGSTENGEIKCQVKK